MMPRKDSVFTMTNMAKMESVMLYCERSNSRCGSAGGGVNSNGFSVLGSAEAAGFSVEALVSSERKIVPRRSATAGTRGAVVSESAAAVWARARRVAS
eukprot:scaffold274374_cov40-Tisochrysis_lutea.AAC.1